MTLVRNIEEIVCWARRMDQRDVLTERLRAEPGCNVRGVGSSKEAVLGADIVVVATAAREPVIKANWLAPGQHLTSVGADDETECEVAPELLSQADLLVVDDPKPQRAMETLRER